MLAYTDTISFLPNLDRASDSRMANLCRTWKNSNIPSAQSGVFYDNMKTFEAKGKGLVHVIIHASMIYPKVYYCFDVADNDGACCSYPSFKDKNFDVHEHAENVMLMVEHALNDFAKGYKVTKKLITTALSKMKESITEEPERNRDENGWYICPIIKAEDGHDIVAVARETFDAMTAELEELRKHEVEWDLAKARIRELETENKQLKGE